MKIRADFVTNSSSSSYVTVTLKLKNGDEVDIGFEETGEWDDRYLPDTINGHAIKGKARKRNDDISTVSELAARIVRCTDVGDGGLIPPEVYPILLDVYSNPDRAEALYETLSEMDWLDIDEYDEYDEDFLEWIQEDFLPYKTHLVLDAMKDIDDLSEIGSIHVFRQDWERGSEMDLALESPDEWEFFSDHNAMRELEYDYVIDDGIESSVSETDTIKLSNTTTIELEGKKVVTTGLTAADERWVQEQVESRGGEYKPKFVVSLDYLIYNPDYDHETVKYTRAKEQIEKGKDVKILTLNEFKDMI